MMTILHLLGTMAQAHQRPLGLGSRMTIAPLLGQPRELSPLARPGRSR
jgi:hypothetical protein